MSRRAVVALVVALSSLGPAVSSATEDSVVVGVDAVVAEPVAETVRVLGHLVASQRGTVSTRVGGLVAAIEVVVGERVAQGDVLARIDDEMLVLARALAIASLAEAEAAVADAEAAEAATAAAIDTAKARRGTAQAELERIEKLRNSVAFSQARFDDLTNEVAVAESLIAEAVARRRGAAATIERERAAVARARAQLAIADAAIADAVIRAPYGGVVVGRATEAGAYVASGDPIVDLLNDASLEVAADVPADLIQPLAPGLRVAAELDGALVEATVRAVIADENPMTRTRPVRFALAGAPGLAAGQGVILHLPVGPPRRTLTVAKDAVLREPAGAAVFVVVDGRAEHRAVELGGAVGDRFEVISGLAEGDRVVVRGNERLAPGQAVSF